MPEVENPTKKTLTELGINDPLEIETRFAEVRERFDRQLDAKIPPDKANYKLMHDAWLGRKSGIVTSISENWLNPAPPHLKRVVGRLLNDLRPYIENRLEGFRVAGEKTPVVPEQVDLTLPGIWHPLGSLHPITQVQREIEDIFINLGFAIESGPEIESVEYNFDALNIPESHPSRDDWDTLYIDAKTVLRTHTSPVQIRAMRQYGAPLHIIIPGKCYRRDNPDSTHSPMFHQIEGLAIDESITFADLKGTLDFFARKFFGGKTRTSFHPSFFPFTEPSGEVAISCPFCEGEGCRVCKQSGWIEVMGCGMVHPVVLRNGGIDPERFTGWAFGLGVERYAMMKYGINDIQLFYQSDVRFLEQF